jgi:hypothetical protein
LFFRFGWVIPEIWRVSFLLLLVEFNQFILDVKDASSARPRALQALLFAQWLSSIGSFHKSSKKAQRFSS